jgi:hypothetical protein
VAIGLAHRPYVSLWPILLQNSFGRRAVPAEVSSSAFWGVPAATANLHSDEVTGPICFGKLSQGVTWSLRKGVWKVFPAMRAAWI